MEGKREETLPTDRLRLLLGHGLRRPPILERRPWLRKTLANGRASMMMKFDFCAPGKEKDVNYYTTKRVVKISSLRRKKESA